MNDQTTRDPLAVEEDSAADAAIAASIKINYAELFALTDPGTPGGRAAYDSDDYETDEEADAALDAFFEEIIEAPYEDD